MKKIIGFMGLALIAQTAQAQSFGDSLNQFGQYIDEKADDTKQYIDEHTGNSKGTQSQPGQIGTPIDASGIVPDTSDIMPDQSQSSSSRNSPPPAKSSPGTINVPGIGSGN
jgi:hypothetical protein